MTKGQMRPLKAILFVLAAYGLFQLAIRAPLWVTSYPVRKAHIAKVAMSPGTRYEARISVVKCDNAKAPTLQFSMRDKTTPKQWDSVDLGYPSTTDFDLTWLSENRLQVSYPANYQLDNDPYELSGVKTEFVRKPPTR